jgi:phosphomannomutase
MIYFVVGANNLAGGAVVTASHNPGEYNGIKLCREGANGISLDTGLGEIRDMTTTAPDVSDKATGTVIEKDVVEDWITHVLSFIDARKLRPLKVAVDAGNGMAGKIVPELEPFIPFEITEMYFELDGTFPNHPASPIEPENLADVIAMIRKHHLDAGIAFDGDGDRAFLIDEKGEPVNGTVMSALLTTYFLEKYPNSTILYNAICGRIVPELIEQHGGTGVRTKVGHSFIKNDMRTHKAVFAGEHSGHYYFKENFMADSGLIAAVIGLFILSESGKTLSELVAPLRKEYMQIPETNFEVSDKQAMMKKIAAAFPDTDQNWLDGLTINLADAWVNVRPSNTEPLLRLNVEAKSKQQLDSLVAKVTKLIET